MRDVARAIDEGASHHLGHGVTVPDTNLPGEDDEELVLCSVDVEWRGEPLGQQPLDQREPSLRLVPGRLENGQSPVEPQRLALARRQSVPTRCVRK